MKYFIAAMVARAAALKRGSHPGNLTDESAPTCQRRDDDHRNRRNPLLDRRDRRPWTWRGQLSPPHHAKDAESRRIPFEPNGRPAQILKRRRFLGPKAYVFGGATGEYQGTIRTAWESLVLLANGIEPTRTRAHGRVNREKLAEIDLHWHDLRHEAACRWLAKGLDLRAIQLLLGHADLKTTPRYLNVTDEELRQTMAEKLWNRR